jgi:hypothetical protein
MGATILIVTWQATAGETARAPTTSRHFWHRLEPAAATNGVTMNDGMEPAGASEVETEVDVTEVDDEAADDLEIDPNFAKTAE